MEKFYNSVKIEVGIDEAGRGCLAGQFFWCDGTQKNSVKKNNIESNTRFKIIRAKRAMLREFIENGS